MLSEIASPVEVEAAPGPASVSIPVALDEPVASANIHFELWKKPFKYLKVKFSSELVSKCSLKYFV